MIILEMFKKNEKGSITVMVLSVMMFILVVITASYLAISNKLIDQNKKVSQISKQYEVTNDEMEQEYIKMYKGVDFTNGLGDIDLSGEVNQNDVELIKGYLSQGTELRDEQKLRADINRDQQITDYDLKMLEEYLKR